MSGWYMGGAWYGGGILLSSECCGARLMYTKVLLNSSPNNISRYISFTLVSSLKVGEKRIREGLILFELVINS